MIGRSLDMIGTYNDLDNQQQVVALIDDVCTLPNLEYNGKYDLRSFLYRLFNYRICALIVENVT